MGQDSYQILIDRLKTAVGLLDLAPNSPLKQDVLAVSDRFASLTFRIAVFAPFNYGKSTLLNALLGERALPIDLIPTTGAAILVKYGETLSTCVRLQDGREIVEQGTEVLKRYAILDDQRRMRDDVASVTVYCPHPFLQTGVELLDLPGTDDREAQDALVKNQLLTADLIVQVLDGRKLMTLQERENLRDWLSDRQIETVVFVVNFLNLLEPDEQKQVAHRLRFVAESFRARLPAGVNNLYRVDALPALRARLKGDMAAAQTTGLPIFESALQTIVQAHQEQREVRLPRVLAIAQQVKQALVSKIAAVNAELHTVDEKAQKKLEIQQKAEQLIRKGFAKSVAEFRDWLFLPNLLDRYQTEAALAIQQDSFRAWEMGEFKAVAITHQQAVVKWVHQACEFFDRSRPTQLLVGFPTAPKAESSDSLVPPVNQSGNATPVAIATGLGWVLGGPAAAAVLGGASYLFNRTFNAADTSEPLPNSPNFQDCLDVARYYLTHFSTLNLAALQRYEIAAEKVIRFEGAIVPQQATAQHYQLDLLKNTLDELEQVLLAVG